jgi:hypothetical protein
MVVLHGVRPDSDARERVKMRGPPKSRQVPGILPSLLPVKGEERGGCRCVSSTQGYNPGGYMGYPQPSPRGKVQRLNGTPRKRKIQSIPLGNQDRVKPNKPALLHPSEMQGWPRGPGVPLTRTDVPATEPRKPDVAERGGWYPHVRPS